MKINILEISKNKDFDLEIVLVNNLNQIECEKDREILENLEFKVKDETAVLLAQSKKIYASFEEFTYDSLAIAMATAIKRFNSTNYKSVKLLLNNSLKDNFKALVEGSILGSYSFDNYKSEKSNKKQELAFVVDDKDSQLTTILKESQTICEAVNSARDMVNTAPADFTPKSFVKRGTKYCKRV